MKYLLLLCSMMLLNGTWAPAQISRETVNYFQDLKMDIYQRDDLDEQPVLLFVHGGGFTGGNRDSGDIESLAMRLADEMTVVSISYRLTMVGKGFGCDVKAGDKLQAFASASLDAARATLYLINNAADLRINPEKIILAGSSAGAETVLHLAYWKDASTFDGRSVLPPGFRYAGVISLAGALIDDQLITSENSMPTMLVHGTCDNLVPYDYAPHHYCDKGLPGYLMLHGGASIARRLDYLARPYYLITICGGDHDWATISIREMHDEMLDFIRQDVLGGRKRSLHEWVSGSHNCNYPEAGICK
ncbi:alpha/beta hydrolase [Fulvivirga sedimenti]|uniref:Alpha/beta hydrolase fold domain-containing protein n=1 Tax=Fulvivirga sedimenti TaxID=2879465 RepID=A0A9X1HVW2_9BACT|nr:alpha/beta hydrolase [Fulvivirga sedimenti]MCA6079224.1 alpha/beta hydrolase fold domain-containing protein [Fulvivirga sedimenti]